jgi:aryl-alcohol dehydrogenase-like predicted oxidoreductase
MRAILPNHPLKENPLIELDAPLDRTVLGLGTIVTKGYGPTNARGFRDLVEYALAMGIRQFDTAAVYGDGVSERLLGDALADAAIQEISVTTKIGVSPALGETRYAISGQPQTLRGQAEAALERLQLPSVDTILIHHPDPNADPLEQMDVLLELRAEGLCRRVGFSNFPPQAVNRLLARGNVDVVQYPWSLLDSRYIDILESAGAAGCDRMVFGTFASGILAGQVNRDTTFESDDWRGIAVSGRDPGTTGAPFYLGAQFDRSLRSAEAIAKAFPGTPLVSAVLALTLATMPSERVVIGCRSEAELRELRDALSSPLTADDVARVAALELNKVY